RAGQQPPRDAREQPRAPGEPPRAAGARSAPRPGGRSAAASASRAGGAVRSASLAGVRAAPRRLAAGGRRGPAEPGGGAYRGAGAAVAGAGSGGAPVRPGRLRERGGGQGARAPPFRAGGGAMSARILLLSPLERIRIVMNANPFGPISVEEAALVAQNCEERAYGKGDVLFEKGGPIDSFHIVSSGEVQVSGAEHGDRVLGPGRTIGFLSMLSRIETGLDAVARGDVRTLQMRADVLSEVMEDRVSILFGALRRIMRETLEVRRNVPEGTRLGGAVTFPELVATPRIDLVARLRVLRKSSIFRRAGVGTLVQMATSIE